MSVGTKRSVWWEKWRRKISWRCPFKACPSVILFLFFNSSGLHRQQLNSSIKQALYLNYQQLSAGLEELHVWSGRHNNVFKLPMSTVQDQRPALNSSVFPPQQHNAAWNRSNSLRVLIAQCLPHSCASWMLTLQQLNAYHETALCLPHSSTVITLQQINASSTFTTQRLPHSRSMFTRNSECLPHDNWVYTLH